VDDTTQLAWRVAQGDRRAFEDLVRATQADVWRWCAHLVDPQSADDLTQETFLRAARSLRGFRGEGSGRAFLLGVARRTCLDELRRRGRRDALQRRVAAWDRPDRHGTPSAEDAVAVEDLIAALPVDRREAFLLTQLLGLSYAETAEVLDVPIGTVRSRVARAREWMVGQLDQAWRAGEG